MKSSIKRAFVSCFLLIALPVTILADDITIGDVTFIEGKTATIDVVLNNPTKSYTGFQCDIYLPEVLTYVSFSRNSDRLLSVHTASVTKNTNGFYRLLVYSSPATAVAGTTGTVVTLTVEVDDMADPGTTTIEIKNKKFRDSNGGNNIFDNTSQNFDVKIAATIGSSGYCSFSWPRDLDFTDCDNFEYVFVGKEESENVVKITSIEDNQVPAGTGVLIQGTPGTTVYPQTTNNVKAVSSIFVGTSEGKVTVANKGDAWALATLEGKTGFYPCNAGVVIPQYKCYLPGGYSGKSFVMIKKEITNDKVVSDDAGIVDGINAMEGDASNGTYYDLHGRRVSTPRHGVYIQDGKKVIVK